MKEKDEAEKMAQHIQTTIQKLYKYIPKAPLIVEATMEEQVSKIGEVMKGFREHI